MEHLLQDPAFWVAVSFIGFFMLAARFAFPPISRSLDERADRIKQELDEAVRLREEAQAILASYQKKQREVLQEAEEILKTAQEEAESMKVEGEKQIKDAIKRRIDMAQEKIARAEGKALQDVHDNMVDIAVSAARSIIKEHLESAGDEEDTIELAIKDIDRIVH